MENQHRSGKSTTWSSDTPGSDQLSELADDPDGFLAALQAVEWSAFTPERDLVPLRTALADLERTNGVTEAHRFATGQIRSGGALLRHPHGHRVELTGFALSPCSRYLAVGSWCGDDYEEGGALQIWELAAGRCVNVIDEIEGGVGWPDHRRTIQWSADGQRIGLAYNTNLVGVWDPFGAQTGPIAAADVTDGGSRPPSFALAPDGQRAYILMAAPREVHGCIAPVREGHLFYNPYHDDGSALGWLAETLPEPVKATLGDDELFLDLVFWSRDGSRLYGSGWGWACSIDVASGNVAWLTRAGVRGDGPAWSRDERFVAYQLHGQLVIADAATGQPVAEHAGNPGASFLCWGTSGGEPRLAVVVPADNDEGARPGVAVYDEKEHRYTVEVAVKDIDSEDSDARSWAWAPDGEHAACLTPDDRIEIWALGERPERLRVISAPEDTAGVLWGADGVIVALGETTLRFVRAATGDTVGDVTFLREPPGPRPLEVHGDDHSEDIGYELEMAVEPTFALDDDTWAAAFEAGVVIAPEGRREDLDAVLAWTVDRRFAWPTHWGELTVVPHAAPALERLGPVVEEYLEYFDDEAESAPAGAAVAGLAQEWPPPNTATVDDLFEVARSSVAPLHSGWDHHVGSYLHHTARLWARRGEVAEAMRLVTDIPTGHVRIRATADVAMILAAAGDTEQARSVFGVTETDIEAVIDEYNAAFVASSVGGAYAALGDAARADAWFDRARAAIEPENNPGEHRLAVVWALIECGRVDQARGLWQAETDTPSTFYSVPLLAYLVRTGHDDLVRELLPTGRGQDGNDWGVGWYDGWDAPQAFTALGRPDLVREWAAIYGDRYAYEDLLDRAEMNARIDPGDRPTEADIAALCEAYAELQRTPRAKREHPTSQLVQQAAECGHIGAVLDLLSALPDGDFNGQPVNAFRALWTVATGTDVEPW